MTVIEELWFGNIAPSVRNVRKGSEFQALANQAAKAEEKLLEGMSAETKEVFEDFCEKEQLMSSIGETDAFVKGFRLGAKIMLEVVGEYASQLPELEG